MVKVGMATWKALNARRSTRDLDTQDRMAKAFKAEWLHLNIFGEDGALIEILGFATIVCN
jgi:hypothetical protein